MRKHPDYPPTITPLDKEGGRLALRFVAMKDKAVPTDLAAWMDSGLMLGSFKAEMRLQQAFKK